MKRFVAIVALLCLAAGAVFGRGGGGCVEEGTLIRTPTGEVPIEQLRVGDHVDGGVVQAVTRVEPEEFVELNIGGHRLLVTAEHPVAVGRGEFQVARKLGGARVPATRSAYNLLVMPGGTYFANGVLVHNKGCFLPDTPILRADGEEVPICDVRAGDRVLAFQPDGAVTTATVRGVLTHEVDEYLVVATERATLRVTAEHPFWVGDGIFKTVEVLAVGDRVFAYDGRGLSAQRIVSFERRRSPSRVFNLQTDAPNTFFAHGIAVHNKGGGGGGGGRGGGGFRSGGSHYRGGRSSGTGKGDPRVVFFFFGFMVVMVILIKAAQARQRAEENLDYVYSPDDVAGKAAKTRKLLEFIARTDGAFAAQALQQRVTETFLKLQECWQAREHEAMRGVLMPDLFAAHSAQLAGLRRQHEINIIEGVRVDRVDLVNVRYPRKENEREFTALITATARDYYVDDRTRETLRGDDAPAQFQEFWTFQRQNGQWLLREIEQTRESDVLKDENFFEPFTNKGVEQVYGITAAGAGVAGPWLEKTVETKATKIERLLNFLGQTDKLWNRQAMLERAREVFLRVYLSREAGDVTQVPEADLFPSVATDLRQQIQRQRQQGVTVEFRNLCVRKAELILVRNFADNKQDRFTVRISAHAQRTVSRAGAVVSREEFVTPFEEYWTFGRLDGQWKLREVLPPAQGELEVEAENVDEDSSREQLQWYYRQPRAN